MRPLACLIALLALCSAAAEEPMDTSTETAAGTQLRVAEAIYHVADLETALSFYTDVLGAQLLWNLGGNMAAVSLGGRYVLVLIPASYDKDWIEGQPVPRPLLSLESRTSLYDEYDRLTALGLTGELGGDQASMLYANLTDPFGNEIMVWQDTAGAYSTPVLEPATAPYPFVELLFFVDDLPATEAFYKDKLGFSELLRHGDVYTALTLGSDLPLGLMSWRAWFDTPAADEPPAAPRIALECADIAAEHARLAALIEGIEPLNGSADGLEWFTIHDPSGNPLTFWQYGRAR